MKITRLLSLGLLVVLAACDGDGVVRPAQVDVKFVNAAPNLEYLRLLREEVDAGWSTIATSDGIPVTGFGDGRGRAIDSGSYDFHLEYRGPGEQGFTRVSSFTRTLDSTNDYTLVAIAPGGTPQLIEVVTDDVAASSTTTRFTFVHANPNLGAVDVYMEDTAGLTPDAVSKGTVSFGATPITFDMPTGNYRVYLTAPGDPATLLFVSASEEVVFGRDDVIVIYDAGGEGFAEMLMTRVRNDSQRIGQLGLPGRVRAIQGIDDRLPRDILLDDNTTTPLFESLPFAVPPDYVEIAPGFHNLSVTPEDSPGTIEATFEFTSVVGRYVTALYAGNSTDGVETQFVLEDKRPVDAQATVRVLNIAGLFPGISVFIEPPGTNVLDATPIVDLNPPGNSGRLRLVPGDYEITIQDRSTEAILAGPEPLTLENRGVYGIMLVNSAGASTIDIVRYEGFTP